MLIKGKEVEPHFLVDVLKETDLVLIEIGASFSHEPLWSAVQVFVMALHDVVGVVPPIVFQDECSSESVHLLLHDRHCGDNDQADAWTRISEDLVNQAFPLAGREVDKAVSALMQNQQRGKLALLEAAVAVVGEQFHEDGFLEAFLLGTPAFFVTVSFLEAGISASRGELFSRLFRNVMR